MTEDDVDVSWDLDGVNVSMDLIPRDEGDLRVRFRDENDDVIWSSIYERGFWTSRTEKGEIGNKLAANTDYADKTIKDALEDVWTDLTENTEEYEESLLSPSVDQLIENTVRVENFGGEEREIHVYVKGQPKGKLTNGREADGGAEVRKLVFQNSEWVRSSGDTQSPPVVEKYSNAFFEVLDITWSEWTDDIRAVWEDMQERVDDTQTTTAERIAMSVARSLKHRIDAYVDESKVLNDTWNGWYEEDSEHGEVVWVLGDTLDEAMDKHDKGIDYRPQLSRALRSKGYTVDTRKQSTINGEEVSLYPFVPEVLGINEPAVDVVGYDDDDDDGEAGIDDDGGDDGGDSPDAPDTEDSSPTTGEDGPESQSETAAPEPPTPPEPDPDSPSPAEATGTLEEVVSIINEQAPAGEGVQEANVVATAASERNIAPPDEIRDEIEEGVLDGVLYRPGGNASKVAVAPESNDDPPSSTVDPAEEGVPEP